MSPFSKDSLSRFVFACGGSAIALWLLWRGLGNPLTEGADKTYFVGALGVGVLGYALRFSRRFDLALAAVGVLGIAVMVWGLGTIEHPVLLNRLWLGFGKNVTTAALLLAPAVGLLLVPNASIPRPYRLAAYAALAGVALVGALSFFQMRRSLVQPDHAAYLFNELYAVAAGHVPYADFIPQYQTLYSYILYPIIALFGAEQALNPMLVALSALSLCNIALGVAAGLLATGGLNRVLAPLLILPLVFLTQGPERVLWGGSISALHSAFPVRMLVPTLIGVLLACLPALGAQRWHSYRQLLPLGALVGLNVYHQIDFGLAAAVALGAVLVVAEPAGHMLRSVGKYGLAVVAGFLAVPVVHWLADRPLDSAKIGWFVRQFGGGFGSEPIQVPGPVLVVLPLIVGATATCLAALRAQRSALGAGAWEGLGLLARLRRSEAAPELTGAPPELARALKDSAPSLLAVHRAALIGSYFGVFSIAAFPYYLNRSFASGQLQILLLPLGVALCASAQIIVASPEWQDTTRLGIAKGLTLRLALAIPVASLLLLPSPSHELERLGGTHAETEWPTPRTQAIVALGEGWKKLGTRDTVGYLGNDGNYIEASTGLHNLTRFNSPLDAIMSPAAQAELCAGIARDDLRVLILGDGAPNPSRCQGQWTIKRDRTGVLVAFRQQVDPAANAKVASAP